MVEVIGTEHVPCTCACAFESDGVIGEDVVWHSDDSSAATLYSLRGAPERGRVTNIVEAIGVVWAQNLLAEQCSIGGPWNRAQSWASWQIATSFGHPAPDRETESSISRRDFQPVLPRGCSGRFHDASTQ
jgi:hypothetical protein